MNLIGKKAPLFEAPAVVDGTTVVKNFSLKQFLDKKEVILFFYPKDFTFVCPTELIVLQNQLKSFESQGVAIVGCSTDTEETHLAWLNTPIQQGGIKGITYPLIADVTKTIAANYGVLGGTWMYNDTQDQLAFQGTPIAYRGTFFIDKQGIVRHIMMNDFPLGRNIEYGEVCPANWKQGNDAIEATPAGIAADYLTKHMDLS